MGIMGHLLTLNPKSEYRPDSLRSCGIFENPKQVQISKYKIQNLL